MTPHTSTPPAPCEARDHPCSQMPAARQALQEQPWWPESRQEGWLFPLSSQDAWHALSLPAHRQGRCKYLHSVPADPHTTVCLSFVQGRIYFIHGEHAGIQTSPCSPSAQGLFTPLFLHSQCSALSRLCSRAFLPDTKLCFGFSKPQWS